MIKRLLFLFLLPCEYLAAQNWSPVTVSDTFHFRRDGDAFMTVSFRANSITVSAGDTLFTFDPIASDSGLSYPAGPFSCTTCYGRINQPQYICGYSIDKRQNGTCVFTGNTIQVLQTQDTLGASWLFDTTQNLTAQLVAVTMGTVLGQPDSLKIALLNNGDSLVWSKSYGIVQWPAGGGMYYRLAGIEGRNLGDRVPRMRDYFDFQPGDIFEYRTSYMESIYRWYCTTTKITVTSRQDFPNAVLYGYDGVEQYSGYNYYNPPNQQYYSDTNTFTRVVSWMDSLHNPANAFNNTLLTTNNVATFGMASSFVGLIDSVYGGYWNVAHLFTDSLGIPGIRYGATGVVACGGIQGNGPFGSFLVGTDTIATYGSNGTYGVHCRGVGATLQKGLGQTNLILHWHCLDGYWYIEQLTAYRKGTDTVGVLTPDSVLLGMQPLTIREEEFMFFPNPADARVTIITGTNETVQVRVFDVQGKIMQEISVSGNAELNTAEWTNGVYIVELKTPEGTRHEKLVVRH